MASDKIEKALSVMVFDKSIRGYLRANDPKALAQAFDALYAEASTNVSREALVNARRQHCKGAACFFEQTCKCQCGPCTARYGTDGVWR